MIEDTDQFISAHLDSVRNEIIKMSLFIEVGGLLLLLPWLLFLILVDRRPHHGIWSGGVWYLWNEP